MATTNLKPRTAQRAVAPAGGVPSETIRGVTLDCAESLDRYAHWDAPTAIVVDGPYGVRGFPGDPPTPEDLGDWYEPYVAAWTRYSMPSTTLWFWGTEVGWATVHPTLLRHGWAYNRACVWDKGVAHVAGNVNGDTIRGFPVVSEMCVQYTRDVHLDHEGTPLPMKAWLRAEWQRSGLPLSRSNEAAGVKDAATRKWFTQSWLWYFPPPESMERLARYAAEHGAPTDRPYFSLDEVTPLTADAWSRMRAKWNHVHGLTNVWQEGAVRGAERLKVGSAALHGNQKPLSLIERIIAATTDPGDVVWDPFAGLATVGVAAMNLDRRCFGAEHSPEVYAAAVDRLRAADVDLDARLFGTD